MKNTKNALLALLIILAGIIDLPARAQPKEAAKDVVYQLDIKASKLLWTALDNRHKGFILFNSGSLNNFIAGKPTQGTFSINMNSMKNTDNASPEKKKKVDNELRNDNFFAVAKYPVATMVVNKIIPEPNNNNFKVYGLLTIKGITKPVEFTTIMKQNGNTITARASITISRANWNIDHQPSPTNWNPLERLQDKLIDDDIPVSLELVFNKK